MIATYVKSLLLILRHFPADLWRRIGGWNFWGPEDQ